jgi:hypothetical protein
MFQSRVLAKVVAVLAGFALLSPGPIGAQEFKGQIKIGIHKAKLEAGKVYSVVLASKCSDAAFPLVEVHPGHLTILFGNSTREDVNFFIPPKADEYSFYVVSPLGPIMEDVIDYTLTIKPVKEAEKPVLQEKVTIDAKDPIYPPRKARFKAFAIQVKAGHCYIIDLIKTGKEDPYLYLEDADKKIVAEDDDSGGDLNSRIVYRATKDGAFRVIATTLDDTVGVMNLTVRMVPLKK